MQLAMSTGFAAVATWQVPDAVRGRPLAVTFDAVAKGLQDHPGVYWEPDGSFVWTVDRPTRHRLEGQLHDGGAYLQHVELMGTASRAMIEHLIRLVNPEVGDDPDAKLMFQLLRTGVYIDQPSLRRLLEC